MRLCDDCGMTVASATGPCEWYMVHDRVWAAAGMPLGDAGDPRKAGRGVLCIGCLEKRLRRQLRPGDFEKVPLNQVSNRDSVRLRDRKQRAGKRTELQKEAAVAKQRELLRRRVRVVEATTAGPLLTAMPKTGPRGPV